MTIWSSNPASRYVSKTTEIRSSERYIFSPVHCSTIHHRQSIEQLTCLSTDGWIRKKKKQNKILFSAKKESDPATCNIIDSSGGHPAGCNKDKCCMTLLPGTTSESNSKTQSVEWWFPGLEEVWECIRNKDGIHLSLCAPQTPAFNLELTFLGVSPIIKVTLHFCHQKKMYLNFFCIFYDENTIWDTFHNTYVSHSAKE